MSEMTYIVSSGELNSTPTNQLLQHSQLQLDKFSEHEILFFLTNEKLCSSSTFRFGNIKCQVLDDSIIASVKFLQDSVYPGIISYHII